MILPIDYNAAGLFKKYTHYYKNPSTIIDKVLEEVSNRAMKKFYLSTTIKCDMDFQNFPFDEHVCNLEVS